MWNRLDLKMRAKQSFRNNYWACVVVAFIMTIVATMCGAGNAANGRNANGRNAGAIGYTADYLDPGINDYSQAFSLAGMLIGAVALSIAIFAILFSIFVGSLLEVGGSRFFVKNQMERPTVGTVFWAFKSGHYGNIVLTMFLRDLFIGLWTMLLVIPGIVKMYEYLMIPYILAENPGMNRREAFLISKRMMQGEKMNAFILSLSFLGWYILSGITCGLVGFFYVTPYVQATFAELYTVNRAKAIEEGYIR